MRRIGVWAAVLAVLLTACRLPERTVQPPAAPSSPTACAQWVKAVWVPYMEVNTLLQGDAETVKAAITHCMEDCAERGCNTVYWHVRANSDAYYASERFLSPACVSALLQEGLDPLAFAVSQAHEKGLALHAWINPYRIGKDERFAASADRFCVEESWYYVPTSEKTKALVLDGVRELLARYAIDGVQFDDYFYPSNAVEADRPADFEAADYETYLARGGENDVGNWRREQVSALIAQTAALCKDKQCVFGVSPACDVQKNREMLYADVERWMREGMLDYVAPQLYVGFANEAKPFDEVLGEWDALPRAAEVSLIAGLALYKTGLSKDVYAGEGSAEWACGGDILARQAAAVKALAWDGVALYAHRSFAVCEGEDRADAVVKKEIDSLSATW